MADSPDRIGAGADPFILILFSGPTRPGDIAERAAAIGLRVICVDTQQGGDKHDIHDSRTQTDILRHCNSKRDGGTELVTAAHIATPCRSFSPLLHHYGLRSTTDPMGAQAPPEWKAYISRENALVEFSAIVARTLLSRSCIVTWENPPPLDSAGDPWHWPERSHISSIWHTPILRKLTSDFGLLRATAPMCMFGGRYRKYFSLLGPPSISSVLAELDQLRCPGTGSHQQHLPAYGLNASGDSNSRLSGLYPTRLNDFILRALTTRIDTEIARPATGDRVTPTPTDESTSQPQLPPQGEEPITAGRAAAGPALETPIMEMVNQARTAPPGFSSLRHLRHATPEELMRSALPDVRQMARDLAVATSEGTETHHPADPGSRRIQWDGVGDWRDLVPDAPHGNVSLSDLVS